MLVALFGPSCSGKTTLGKLLAGRNGWEFRGCGELVRQLAAVQGIAIPALSLSDHAEIDRETAIWSVQAGSRIVEGRFLDQVLSDIASDAGCILIEIAASLEVRAERWAKRLERPQSTDDVRTFDAEDASFRVQAYGGAARLSPNFTIDTTGRSADACLEEIERHLRR